MMDDTQEMLKALWAIQDCLEALRSEMRDQRPLFLVVNGNADVQQLMTDLNCGERMSVSDYIRDELANVLKVKGDS